MLLLRHYCVAAVMSNTVVVTLSHALTKWPAQESGFQIADTVVYKEQERGLKVPTFWSVITADDY